MSEDISKHTSYPVNGHSLNLPAVSTSAIKLSISANGEPMADSREVAIRLGRDHKAVLRSIKGLDCSNDFKGENFTPFKTNDLTGETIAHYLMTEKGFVYLCRSLKGEVAATIFEAFVNEFYRMREELRRIKNTQSQVPAIATRRMVRRSKEELAIARAEVVRVQAETTRVVQEAAASTVKTYADLLQSVLSFDANAAFIAGCNAAKAAHGVDIRQSTAITHIDSESQQTWHTPTELGKIENGLSAMKINQMLEQAGLQTKPDGKQWIPTDSGKKYSRILDTGKKHNSGVPVVQVKWSKDVLQKMGSTA